MPGSASAVTRLPPDPASLPRRIATRSARTTASSIAEREIGSICIPFPWCCRHRPRRPRAALALALVLALPALAPAPTLPLPPAPAPTPLARHQVHRLARAAAAALLPLRQNHQSPPPSPRAVLVAQALAPAHHRTARPAAARIHLAQNRLAVALRHRQTQKTKKTPQTTRAPQPAATQARQAAVT